MKNSKMGKWRVCFNSEWLGGAKPHGGFAERGLFGKGAHQQPSQSGRPARLEGAPGVSKRCSGARGGGPLSTGRGSAPASESSATRQGIARGQRVRLRFNRTSGTPLLVRLGNAPFNDQTWIRIGWSRRPRWRRAKRLRPTMPPKPPPKTPAGQDKELLHRLGAQLKEMKVNDRTEAGQGLFAGQAMARAAAQDERERALQDKMRQQQETERQMAARMETAIEAQGTILARLRAQGQATEVSQQAINAVQRGTEGGVSVEVASVALLGVAAAAYVPSTYSFTKGEAVHELTKSNGAHIRLQFPPGSDIDDIQVNHMLKQFSATAPSFIRLSGSTPIVLWRNPNLQPGQGQGLVSQLVQGTELKLPEYELPVEAQVYHPQQEARLVMDGDGLRRMWHVLETLEDMGLTYLQAEEFLVQQLRDHVEADAEFSQQIRYVRIDNGQRQQDRWINLSFKSAAKKMGTKILVGLAPECLAELEVRPKAAHIKITVGDLVLHHAKVYLKAPDKTADDAPEAIIMNRQRQWRVDSKARLQEMVDSLSLVKQVSQAQKVYLGIRASIADIPEDMKRKIDPILQPLHQSAQQNEQVQPEDIRHLREQVERFVHVGADNMWQEENANQTLLRVAPKSTDFWDELRQKILPRDRPDEKAWKRELKGVLDEALGEGMVKDAEITLETGGRFYPKNRTSFVILYCADPDSALSQISSKKAFTRVFEVSKIVRNAANALSTQTAVEALQDFFDQNVARGVWVPAKVRGQGVDVHTTMSTLRSDEQSYGPYDVRRMGQELDLSQEEDNKLLEALVKLQRDGRVVVVQPKVGDTTLFLPEATYAALRTIARDQAWLQDLTFGEDIEEIVRPLLERMLEDMILYAAAGGVFIEGKTYIQNVRDHEAWTGVDGPRSLGNTIQRHPFMKGGVQEAARTLEKVVGKLIQERQLDAHEADGCTLLVGRGQLYTITADTAAKLQPQSDIGAEALTWREDAKEVVARSVREYLRRHMVLRLPKETEDSWRDVAAMTGKAVRFRRVLHTQYLTGGWSRVEAPTIGKKLAEAKDDVIELTDEEWQEAGEPRLQLGARVGTSNGVWQLAPKGTLEDVFPEYHPPVLYPYIKAVLNEMHEAGEVWSVATLDYGIIVMAPSSNGTDGEARFQKTLPAPKISEKLDIRKKCTTTLDMLDHTRATLEYEQLQAIVSRWQLNAMENWIQAALPIFVRTHMGEPVAEFMCEGVEGFPPDTPSYLFTAWGEKEMMSVLTELVEGEELDCKAVDKGLIYMKRSLAEHLELPWQELEIGRMQGQELKKHLEHEHRQLKKRAHETPGGDDAEEEEAETMRDVGEAESKDTETTDSQPPKKK